jgi:hypothetical protein
MAICTCPDGGGREATQEDIDYLGAQILQMTATAQESDAMRAEAIPAWLRTSLAGDFRLASDFSDLMRPYLLSHFETTHRRDITVNADEKVIRSSRSRPEPGIHPGEPPVDGEAVSTLQQFLN